MNFLGRYLGLHYTVKYSRSGEQWLTTVFVLVHRLFFKLMPVFWFTLGSLIAVSEMNGWSQASVISRMQLSLTNFVAICCFNSSILLAAQHGQVLHWWEKCWEVVPCVVACAAFLGLQPCSLAFASCLCSAWASYPLGWWTTESPTSWLCPPVEELSSNTLLGPQSDLLGIVPAVDEKHWKEDLLCLCLYHLASNTH